ncbi:GAF domain-containing protein [Planktothrix sp. FACHB-1355]|uniref:GAF domain-containing protein n=1 Tax=Aerosakkonema funiforme FACHB-1375 TaxID=2949571 RepID=A0A926V9C9_9CYAN|nr:MULTISPECIES: GAF domain-containing protein [Oscillatoriales]MBD2179597.1 GAF domain-containing protein [Aerosakkonema funiforme FACHB-1375]MBD3562453.1 GAF domain-containing protein [Planktothrix sp. FACHB-1355]
MNHLKPISSGAVSKSEIELAQQGKENQANEQNVQNKEIFLSKASLTANDEAYIPQTAETEATDASEKDLNWLVCFQQNSQQLVAAIELPDFAIRYANNYFSRLVGIEVNRQEIGIKGIGLSDLFSDWDGPDGESLYRRLLLGLVLQDIYQIDIQGLFDQPIVASVGKSDRQELRWVEFWLRLPDKSADEWPQLKVVRLDRNVDEFADLNIEQMETGDWQNWLRNSAQIELLLSRLQPNNYRVEGLLLLEGVDVTIREMLRRLTNLLIDQDSILRPKKFRKIDQLLRSVLHAKNSLILSTERSEARLFFGPDSKDLRTTTYSMQSLQGSHFLRAAEANQVWNVADLSQDCPTECERWLLEMGVRSLLLIPLVVKAKGYKAGFRQLAGVVGLTSDRAYNFSSLDCRYASELILPFTVALRQAIQLRFTQFNNIHPAVEWKFLQEAERRSWGMRPEPIIFSNVYPLYGISDIRGSSEERNRAIQTDVLEQFHLGLKVVEAFCQSQETSLGEQLRLDLLYHIEQIESGITVDAEVTAIRYLRSSLEIYFDYFAQCCPNVNAAVAAYRSACDNEHQCVYKARDRYDRTIGQINALLRETWDRWQVSMQKITPHYCDIESTDGIDHMIYAGASIDPKFSTFHLRSLRYEQLRAMCDCARTAFSIQAQYNTQMQVTHLVLVQDATVDIFHNEDTEKLFEVRGTRDTRYELVKKRIDKAIDTQSHERITQPGMLTIVYSTDDEWTEYQQYLRYLAREGWIDREVEGGTVEPLQGVTGLKFARVRVLPNIKSITDLKMLDEGLEPPNL